MLDFISDTDSSRNGLSQRHSTWIAVLAGLITAMAAAILVCRSPQSATTPQLTLVLLAAAYLMLTTLSGATGSYVYWARSKSWSQSWPASHFVELIQSTATGWVWIPAIVLLSRQDSVWAPTVAAAGSVVLTVALRKSGPTAAQIPIDLESDELAQPEIFTQTLQSFKREWYGPLVAICLFGEIVVLAEGWLFLACLLLAIAGFAFAWARTPATLTGQQSVRKLTAKTLRQTKSALPALIVTVLALMIGVSHDIQEGFGLGIGHHGMGTSLVPPKTEVSLGRGGHVSIILLSAPQKQQFYAPQKRDPMVQNTRLAKPMVLQFDGEYWYFQWPDDGPGAGAYKAHGSPLSAGIHSNSQDPVVMQAHQHLKAPLSLDCCREIDVEIENRSGQSGALAMGMRLIDSSSPKLAPLILEGQPILHQADTASAGQSNFTRTTLRFRIPASKGSGGERIRQFDQVDFAFLTDAAHATTGAKLAIRTLEFIP